MKKRSFTKLFLLLGLLVALLHYGCATAPKVMVRSNVPDAMVTLNGQRIGAVGDGLLVQLPAAQGGQQATLVLRADGYFEERVSVNPANYRGSDGSLPTVNLVARQEVLPITIDSMPSGADVVLGDRIVGKTPFAVDAAFERRTASSPLDPISLELVLDQYETTSVTVRPQAREVSVDLPRLVFPRVFQVAALGERFLEPGRWENIIASVEINGESIGSTPGEGSLAVPITFRRSSSATPFPTFEMTIERVDDFHPMTVELTPSASLDIEARLEQITEYATRIVRPIIDLPPAGATLIVENEDRIAQRDIREPRESVMRDLRRLTNYTRADVAGERYAIINSFTPAFDGVSIVYSETRREPEGGSGDNPFSEIILLSGEGERFTLVSTERYHYFSPTFPKRGAAFSDEIELYILGNGDDAAKTDLYRMVLSTENLDTINSVLTRITSGSRFFNDPAYYAAGEPVYFASLESNWGRAEYAVGSVLSDGRALATSMGITGRNPQPGPNDVIYFVDRDSSTGTLQIFSTRRGTRETSRLINDQSFRDADCYDISLDPTGRYLLFTSNRTSGSESRQNLNIFLLDLEERGVPVQLTRNESDDYSPEWIPDETSGDVDLIYFLSNRGGVVNIWSGRIPLD